MAWLHFPPLLFFLLPVISPLNTCFGSLLFSILAHVPATAVSVNLLCLLWIDAYIILLTFRLFASSFALLVSSLHIYSSNTAFLIFQCFSLLLFSFLSSPPHITIGHITVFLFLYFLT